MEHKQSVNEIQVELSDEMAQGTYANLAIISHSSSEFILDFIRIVPGVPKAKVKSRVILTPANAKRLLYALRDNIDKFDDPSLDEDIAGADPFIPPIVGMPGEA